MEKNGKYFDLKEESVGSLKIYLGGRLHKVELEKGVKEWAFGYNQYFKATVKNVEGY